MHGIILPARRGLSSALAMAVALGAVAAAIPAEAQQNRRQQAAAAPAPSYTPAFIALYEPVAAVANAATGDYAAARGQLAAINAAIQTADDRMAAGNLALMLGNKLTDKALQRQGLEMMIASGKVEPA